MYNIGKYQELNLIILRLQMNLSHNDTNIPKIFHFWVEICINPSDVEVILCVQNGF